MTNPDLALDDKALRKAWLKRKFSSWEYHEELLELHDKYLTTMHAHWARPDIQQKYPDFYRTMCSPVFLNFDKVSKPGETSRSSWDTQKSVGWADAISYNFNRGLGDFGPPFTEYAGMADADRDKLNDIVGKMLFHCQNIKYVVDTGFVNRRTGSDERILDEEVTGPIDWPASWKQELLGEHGAVLATTTGVRVTAGEPVPQTGTWQALDPRGTRHSAQAGDRLPDLHSAYGTTVWQFVQA